MGVIAVFLYLQILDVMSTLIGFSLGNPEGSPFVRLLTRWGPVCGLIVSKLVAIALAGVCLAARKKMLLQIINVWYAGLVVWNLYTSIRTLNL